MGTLSQAPVDPAAEVITLLSQTAREHIETRLRTVTKNRPQIIDCRILRKAFRSAIGLPDSNLLIAKSGTSSDGDRALFLTVEVDQKQLLRVLKVKDYQQLL